MSGVVCEPINFSENDAPQAPEVLRHLGRAKGILAEIQQAEECRIARIVNRFGERHIVLPPDRDLSRYIGQMIIVMGLDDRTLIRRAGECTELQ
jgi:hypothetical protein